MNPVLKARILKFMRNFAISFGVLLIALVGLGVAYTWYVGQNVEPAPVEEVVRTARKEIAPVEVDKNAPVGVSVQALSSPVARGMNASITIHSSPEATCDIKVVYDKTPSDDSGLVQKVADAYGVASWTWTVDETAPVGKWPVTITCAIEERSGVVIGDLKVE